ncbi:DUF2271 domain-containing protein [Capnocytophaga stomatis]|uniref:DUF2271 domain-containing protein n=1 Tax=Capnocytophaga stomatis TaxID=1848904 RepID=A0A250FYW1_9FLAO|nr:DUF2271 domain-containing protein [Capnocytophaga stomatis]ATA89635.1 flagellin biosynthesis protein FlgD [Capnocytophaga stomatis]
MKIRYFLWILAVIFVGFSFTKQQPSTKYKCMIQLTNYDGEGAYIVVSLINPQGKYEKTLQVLGDDPEWYSDLIEWWKFYGKRETIDAITGATISGGERAVKVIEIENDKIDKGYKIRFETAVEDQKYYATDVEFELTSESVKSKVDGKGYIRYVRMMPN